MARFLGLLIVAASFLGGCSADVEKKSFECQVGEVEACECDDEPGERSCAADGRFSACRCASPQPDAGTADGNVTHDAAHDVALSSCLTVDPAQIDFGMVEFGASASAQVTITNCASAGDLQFESATTCGFDDGVCTATEIFTVNTDRLPNALAAGASETLDVTFVPSSFAGHTGELTIEAGGTTATVELSGQVEPPDCSVVAEAKLADGTRWESYINTIPLKTIQFRADHALPVARYEWNIVQLPTNSTARMTPSANVEEPSMFLDLAGQYVIELKVYDNEGTESCGDQALITIIATPDEDIHIQLVWDTPGDADQTDAFGTDLDLHFLHPNGQWNNAPWDIYWLNPTADWGEPGPHDDPSLDIDDTDGAGPENVNMNDPEAGLTYAVGVYYYAANGYGPSYATIRIYIGGSQAYEYRDMFLPTSGTFWYAATITWPTGDVIGINNVREGFPGSAP